MSSVIQVVKDVFQGNYAGDQTPSGGVTPSSFEVAYSPAEIASVMDRGASQIANQAPRSAERPRDRAS